MCFFEGSDSLFEDRSFCGNKIQRVWLVGLLGLQRLVLRGLGKISHEAHEANKIHFGKKKPSFLPGNDHSSPLGVTSRPRSVVVDSTYTTLCVVYVQTVLQQCGVHHFFKAHSWFSMCGSPLFQGSLLVSNVWFTTISGLSCGFHSVVHHYFRALL